MKKILGILGLVIGALAVYFGIMFAPEIKGAFLGNNPEPPTQDVEEQEPTGDVVTDIVDSDALRLTKHNRVSASGQALSVTATLSPDYIIDKTVNWSIAWKGTNSANVNDFITLTPSSDTLTCTVSVKKAFTTQIVLTCSANNNPQVKATCTIDYVGRTLNAKTIMAQETDLCGENFGAYTIREFIDETGYIMDSSSNYELKGGSLNGTFKNLKLVSVKIDGKDVTSKLATNLESWLIAEFGSLGTAMEELENDMDIEYVVSADVYYGDTLIQSGVTYNGGSSYIVVDLSYYKATGITLNDTQLIF